MRYRLRTLLVVLAIGPPLLAGAWHGLARYREWQEAKRWEPGKLLGPTVTLTMHTYCHFNVVSGELAETVSPDEN